MTTAMRAVFGGKPGTLRFREAVDAYVMILPWVLGFVIFTAGPMIASFAFSFAKYDVLTPPQWIGLENYQDLVVDPLFWHSLWNTAYYVFLGAPLRLAMALLAALALNRALAGIGFYRAAFYLPSVIPVVATAVLWMWVFNPDYGMANALLGYVGLPPQKWLWDVNLVKPTFILLAMWHFGTQMVIFLAGLQSIPQTLYEAAALDGANRQQIFWRVTIPMLSPVIFFNLIIAIISGFQVFTTAFIATDGGPRNASLFYMLYLYRNAFSFFKMGYASTLAWVLFLIILAFTALQFYMARRWVYYETD